MPNRLGSKSENSSGERINLIWAGVRQKKEEVGLMSGFNQRSRTSR